MTDWTEIERRLGLHNAQGFVEREILPLLKDVRIEDQTSKGEFENRLQLPMTLGFFGFVATFIALNFFLPDSFIGVALRFILFPLMFLGFLAVAFYAFKDRVVAAITEGQSRFIARSKALTRIASEVGLTYVPSPGGAPSLLKFLVKYDWAPVVLKEAADVLDDHGGMDEALAVARASGAMVSDVTVIGSDQTRDQYLAQQASYQQVEDGFQGEQDGVPFSSFEWMESVEDASNIYHLTMVFELPRKLYGFTQLRSRKIAWPSASSEQDFKSVGLVASDFEERFRLRSTDQVEARAVFDPVVIERVVDIAHGEPVRAVAFDRHLVIDVAGEDRFALVDLITGAWSEETIAASMLNIAQTLELAGAVAHAFKLRAAGSCDMK